MVSEAKWGNDLLEVLGLDTHLNEMSHTYSYVSESWERGSLCCDRESRESVLSILCILVVLEWLPQWHGKRWLLLLQSRDGGSSRLCFQQDSAAAQQEQALPHSLLLPPTPTTALFLLPSFYLSPVFPVRLLFVPGSRHNFLSAQITSVSTLNRWAKMIWSQRS